MSVLLITYDLKKPGQDYSELLKAIKDYPGWARLSESSYAISTDRTPSQVYTQLHAFIDKNDHIYVVTLSKPYSGFGPEKVNDWLESHLPAQSAANQPRHY